MGLHCTDHRLVCGLRVRVRVRLRVRVTVTVTVKIDDSTFVFGQSSDWYKMVAVDATGAKIECRYMNKNLELTKANWEAANRGGSYTVADVEMSNASNARIGVWNESDPIGSWPWVGR